MLRCVQGRAGKSSPSQCVTPGMGVNFPFPSFPRKEIMQEHAAKIGAIIQLQVTRPVAKWKGGPAPLHVRRYVPVAKPQLLLDILPRIPPRQNFTFEIIQKRKPCKICMDFDNAAGLPTGFKDRGTSPPGWRRHWVPSCRPISA
jgi:hypothetical protein